ncbi:conserved exported hypothetical protein [Methylocella tundrae]|jgi:hypothetical protein|uniref:Phosphate starvation-inducible protein PsiF n=1 Tax=Methylocella tundrae TaxID=227605 RepID=A0A4V6IMI7_METTU|nr:PsiF family protein [Methylocella tundrae]WPP06052.1 PsiF family protein [Methylocella tundrae]VFU08644.1 conserved exported protein of unknown function [Methylocella tundrae]VTZ23935.1 conserved exported hypothetical protein [Methylocella tundrae]VTZ48566.1 conserved exported hypothetical protein [Methylocella tundrae]
MKNAFSWIIASALVLSFANISFAQQQAPAAAPAAAAAKPAASDAAKKAKAKECSDQADAKGLHGKARKEFRSKCKRS